VKNKYIRLAQNLGDDMRQLNINAYAASSAFFLFISLVPMFSLISCLIPFTNLTEEYVVRLATSIAPAVFDSFLEGLVSQAYDATGGAITVAVIVLVWTASKSVMALVQGLNVVNDVQEKRNYFHIRLVCCLYMIAMVVATVFSLVITVFGKNIIQGIIRIAPGEFQNILELIYDVILRPRWLYSIIILTLVFGLFYAYLPNKKLHYREQLPGAFIVAVAWTVFSYIFSIYAQHSPQMSIYGSMSVMVIAMLWMYSCVYMLFLGAYLNRYFRPVTLVLAHPKARELRHPAATDRPGSSEDRR
jgi:membrane protein